MVVILTINFPSQIKSKQTWDVFKSQLPVNMTPLCINDTHGQICMILILYFLWGADCYSAINWFA